MYQRKPGNVCGANGIGIKYNATKHGYYLKHLLIRQGKFTENPNDFVELLNEIRSHYTPVGTLEMHLVMRLTENMWKNRRITRFETDELEKIEYNFEYEIDRIANQIFVDQQYILAGKEWPDQNEFSYSTVDNLRNFLNKTLDHWEKNKQLTELEETRLFRLFGSPQLDSEEKKEFISQIDENFLVAKLSYMLELLDAYGCIRKDVLWKTPKPSQMPPPSVIDQLIRLYSHSDSRFSRTIAELNALQDRRKAAEMAAAAFEYKQPTRSAEDEAGD